MAGVETKLVGAGEDGMRLDRWFKTHYAGLPHSRLEKLLRTGQVQGRWGEGQGKHAARQRPDRARAAASRRGAAARSAA